MAMGGWISAAIAGIARLNIADELSARGPMTAAEIASNLNLNADSLQRVLRACASVGLFTEDASGKFGLTPLSEVLTTASPASIKAFVREMGGWWLKMFHTLPDGVRTGKPQVRQVVGMDSWWEFLNANPEELENFGESMKSNSLASMRGVLAHYDFSGVRKIVDIGGGFGHLAIALLEKYPSLRATVFDLPDLTPVSKKNFSGTEDVASRLEFTGGDMFSSVPAGDCFIMKHILHDWNDERSQAILRACHRSLEPNGRLLCVDSVLPPLGDTGATPAKFLDLLMMLGLDGKERTRQQWEDLYASAGFRLRNIIPLQDNFGTYIVEGVKA